MRKVVLELDMVGYSDVARILDESAGPTTVLSLNREIQSFIDKGLERICLKRDDTVMATTGDGAILVFDKGEDAHRFARAVNRAAAEHNASKTIASSKRIFRMGAVTGDVAIQKTDSGAHEIGGIAVADAVRLEGAGAPGALLVDLTTFATMPEDLKDQYGAEEEVRGKRGEKYRVRRCMMDLSADEESKKIPPQTEKSSKPQSSKGASTEAFSALGREASETLEKMIALPDIKVKVLAITLGMPEHQQPRGLPTREEECLFLFKWARDHRKAEKLKSDVQLFLEKEGLA